MNSSHATRSREIAVSAIVVDFDGGVRLEESVGSLFAQTHPNLEVILVDNGSTDGAARRLRDVHGDRLVYLRNEGNLASIPTSGTTT